MLRLQDDSLVDQPLTQDVLARKTLPRAAFYHSWISLLRLSTLHIHVQGFPQNLE